MARSLYVWVVCLDRVREGVLIRGESFLWELRRRFILLLSSDSILDFFRKKKSSRLQQKMVFMCFTEVWKTLQHTAVFLFCVHLHLVALMKISVAYSPSFFKNKRKNIRKKVRWHRRTTSDLKGRELNFPIFLNNNLFTALKLMEEKWINNKLFKVVINKSIECLSCHHWGLLAPLFIRC